MTASYRADRSQPVRYPRDASNEVVALSSGVTNLYVERTLPMRRIVALTLAVAGLTAAGVALAGSPAVAAGRPGTARYVARPVHANGTPVSGYHVVNETSDVVTCTEQSPVAVSPGVDLCSPDASYAVACWKSARGTVLCLRDARSRVLYRLRYTGSFTSSRPLRHISPMALVLSNRAVCSVRDGGAWSGVPSHPSWVGWYSCNDDTAVFGPATGDGINRSAPAWTVYTVSWRTGRIVSRGVLSAYYAGTAA